MANKHKVTIGFEFDYELDKEDMVDIRNTITGALDAALRNIIDIKNGNSVRVKFDAVELVDEEGNTIAFT